MLFVRKSEQFKSIKSQLVNFFTNNWITILCVFGCSGQIFLLTRDYFVKDVTYEVIPVSPIDITIPKISICIPMKSVLNYTKLVVDKWSIFTRCHRNLSRYCILDNYSIESLGSILLEHFDITTIHPYIVSSEQMINFILIHGSMNVSEKGICNTKDYLVYPEVCYTIECTRKDGSPVLAHRFQPNFLAATESLVQIGLKSSLLSSEKRFTISLQSMTHPRREAEYEYGLSVTCPSDRLTFRAQFKFSKRFMVNLPYPYPTDCVNYDRDVTISRCLNNLSFNLFNAPYPRRQIDLLAFSGQSFKLFPEYNDQTLTQLRKIRDICYHDYPHPSCLCEINSLSLLTREFTILPFYTNSTIIEIQAPDEPDLVYFVTPKMALSDCIVMICSVVGFWFGFDVYHDADQIITRLRFIIKKWLTKLTGTINVTSPRYRAAIKPKMIGNQIGKSIIISKVNQQSFSLQSDNQLFQLIK